MFSLSHWKVLPGPPLLEQRKATLLPLETMFKPVIVTFPGDTEIIRCVYCTGAGRLQMSPKVPSPVEKHATGAGTQGTTH